MTEIRFQLIFSGRLRPGSSAEQVRQAIKERFRLNDAQLDRLFGDQPVTVKRGLDRASAERYQRAFAAAGALVELQPAAAIPERAPSAARAPASPLGAAPTSKPSKPGSDTAHSNETAEANTSQRRTAAAPTSNDEEHQAMHLLPPGSLIGEAVSPPAEPPDTSHLQLAPSEATSLEDCAPPPPIPPQLDLSGLELTPIEPSQRHE